MTSIGGLSVQVRVKGMKRALRNLGALTELVSELRLEMRTLVTEAVDALATQFDTGLKGVSGDVRTLQTSIEALQAEVDALKAGQDAAVTAGVEATLADVVAKFKPLADRLTALDDQTPAEVPVPGPEPEAPPAEA